MSTLADLQKQLAAVCCPTCRCRVCGGEFERGSSHLCSIAAKDSNTAKDSDAKGSNAKGEDRLCIVYRDDRDKEFDRIFNLICQYNKTENTTR
jgi:hypothetical protein